MLRRLRIENLVLIGEAELTLAKGLNAVTGETGAGKTILAQAIGLLLGAQGGESFVGPAREEAYVEAELDLPEGLLDDAELQAIRELQPEDETGLVVARRVFADGRTRAYAWGRTVPREDLARVVERLVAMSGQFEQRRLARTSYQLALFDAFAGEAQLARRTELARSWRRLTDAGRHLEEVEDQSAGAAEREAELRDLVERTAGFEQGSEDELKAERTRLARLSELASRALNAAEVLNPEHSESPGATALVARAAAEIEALHDIAPELGLATTQLREAEIQLAETGSDLRNFLSTLEAEPGRLEAVEADLERIAVAKRRFNATSLDDLLEVAERARSELAAREGGGDPVAAARRERDAADKEFARLCDEMSKRRESMREDFVAAVAEGLRGLGVGEGKFRVRLEEREPGPSGRDSIAFELKPNPGLPYSPVAETASGGELSRVALALRTASHSRGGEPTIVFDEIDAGIGGRTAHFVASALEELATFTQVLTITHLPQIASVAAEHFRVQKLAGDPTQTTIERLTRADRRQELERMLGGAEFLSTIR